MVYKVLCLDGGGIKGLISVVLLQRISEALGSEDWLKQAHLVAGTSTGGLIALGLAAGKSLDTLRSLYVDDGPAIFDDSWVDDVKDVGKLIGADYDLENLERALKDNLGADTKLGDLEQRVLITTFDLDNEHPSPAERAWKPKLFHNFAGDDSDAGALAYKVGLYTSAAPSYFPSADGYIDGGVFATNPSMCALAQTQDRRTGENVPLSEVRLLSLGTGRSLLRVEGQKLDWGYAQWAPVLVDILFDGVSGTADYQCRQMLDGRYHRLAPTFPSDVKVDLDDVSKIDYMLAFARSSKLDAAIAETVSWLRSEWSE